ncbi:hypothetical protein [Robertmurraya siralis]|nr:hypothetical protein [Robertmurraya siralis]
MSNIQGKTVVDEFGVVFTNVFSRGETLFGYDVDGNCLEIISKYEVL